MVNIYGNIVLGGIRMIKTIIKVKLSKLFNNVIGIKEGNIFYLNLNFTGFLGDVYTLKFH